jgi:hypothetical protein
LHLVWDKGGKTLRYPLTDGLVIGRSRRCGLVLEDEQVSRRHCRIFRQGAVWCIADLGSLRGTFVNGLPITAATRLSPGDTVELGRYRFLVEDGGSAGSGAAPPSGEDLLHVELIAPLGAPSLGAVDAAAFHLSGPPRGGWVAHVVGNFRDMALLHAGVRRLQEAIPGGGTALRSVTLLDAANEALCGLGARASAVCACIDPRSGKARLGSAAHPFAWLVRHTGEAIPLDLGPAPELGVSPSAVYSELEIQLKGRETLVLFSKGVPGILTRGGRRTEHQALEETLHDLPSEPAAVARRLRLAIEEAQLSPRAGSHAVCLGLANRPSAL